MARISSLILVQLNGQAPVELNLPALRTLSASCEVVKAALLPYLEPTAAIVTVNDLEELETLAPREGTIVIYVVGHGWITGTDYQSSIRNGVDTRFLSADQLIKLLVRSIPQSSPLILLIDTCNAEAVLKEIKVQRSGTSTCAILASLAGDSTLEYPLDQTTRFAAALRASLKKTGRVLDAAELAISIRSRLARPGLMPSQSSAYWIAGDQILVEIDGSQSHGHRRSLSKTHVILRSFFIVIGILFATAAAWTFVYYRTHTLVTIDLPDLATLADSASIEVDRLSPDQNNAIRVFETDALHIRTVQVRLPASDLLIIPKVQFKDGSPREMRIHLNLQPSLRWSDKRIRIVLPTADAIRNHPNMAYIPAGEWEQGPDRQKLASPRPFWIDLKPVSVREYRPFAIDAERKGEIVYSVLLNSERNAAATRATGLNQLPKLMGDLDQVFNIINSSERAGQGHRAQTGNDGANADSQLASEAPCETCPAPLTMDEARNFCEKHGKRVPTDLEWEFAARGVDGRLYPWGNKFDATKTNCVGLPDKGQPPATLQPSDRYVSGASPFGLIDMVGNAGDWVDTGGGYERTYMGGFYAFNPEECMVFKSLPDTGEPPWRKITVRCVQQ